jgi:hypothetical protein
MSETLGCYNCTFSGSAMIEKINKLKLVVAGFRTIDPWLLINKHKLNCVKTIN